MFFSLFQYIPHLFTSITFYLFVNPGSCLSILILVPLLAVRFSNLVHTVSLIANNHLYLSNRKKIENYTANIPGIDRNSGKGIRRLD